MDIDTLSWHILRIFIFVDILYCANISLNLRTDIIQKLLASIYSKGCYCKVPCRSTLYFRNDRSSINVCSYSSAVWNFFTQHFCASFVFENLTYAPESLWVYTVCWLVIFLCSLLHLLIVVLSLHQILSQIWVHFHLLTTVGRLEATVYCILLS